ncbi:MAG: cysteine desulfurase-like protein [Rubripirellula sp.]|nr:cysteine desulfurase-like protein [Rubripirellula sp.]
MTLNDSSVQLLREKFPALAREHNGQPVAFFDGPAGTQVPKSVIDAISHYLIHHNANHAGLFKTSLDSDEMLEQAHQAAADLLGAREPETVSFGANMTTMTFAISRAISQTWSPGDEIVLSHLEHDANFTPWILAARDRGVTVKTIDVNPNDCTLRLEQYQENISERTRLVAVGCASNAVGTINPVKQICHWAAQVGAISFLDAVHYAPHALIDVDDWGCDFLACSAYKFFGPHVGMMYGKRELLETFQPYKLRTSPSSIPGRWMTGTQNHECIAGTLAAIEYLASIDQTTSRDTGDQPTATTRRERIASSMNSICIYERGLIATLIAGLQQLPEIKIWGITDPSRLIERLPTLSITHQRFSPKEIATRLADAGIFVWHGNYYALPLTEKLGVEPEGMVRVGLCHYNTHEEVDRLLDCLSNF